MPDHYQDYETMAQKEAGHFTVSYRLGRSPFAVMAVHGGMIEPRTAEIAAAIAGEEHSFYAFEGVKGGSNTKLHINSHKIKEPAALYVAGRSRWVISIHGCKTREDTDIYLGGLSEELMGTAKDVLSDQGFSVGFARESANEFVSTNFCGDYQDNICNRGIEGAGLQLEITRRLRNVLLPWNRTEYRHSPLFHLFVDSMRLLMMRYIGEKG